MQFSRYKRNTSTTFNLFLFYNPQNDRYNIFENKIDNKN